MKTKMRAAVFEGNGILNVKSVPTPQIRTADEVKIKVITCSICGSDLHVLNVPPGQDATPGIIMGHEIYGIVEEIGNDVTHVQIGDMVTVDPIIPCGHCRDCRNGFGVLCMNAVSTGQTRNGGFAEYCVFPKNQVYVVPTSIPASTASLIEPLSCVMNAIVKLNPTPLDNVIIFGAGAIGLIFIRVLKLYGVKNILVCEPLEERQAFAKHCGADWILNPIKDNLEQSILEKWDSLANIVVDAVGAGVITEQALPLLGSRGRYMIFGQDNNAKSTIAPSLITRHELQVLGSYCTNHTFIKSIDLLHNPKLGLEKVISHRFDLDDIKKGIEVVRSKEASKVIIYPNGMFDD
ncbi:MAG: alcohol dehydrogenase catalytic domain-containing protein [Suipraeoptans sp.]